MSDSPRNLVDACVEAKLALKDAQGKYKAACARLIEAAVEHSDDWYPTALGGNSWVARGSEHMANVTFPRASLKELIDASAKGFVRIRTLSGAAFDALFKPAVAFTPREGFRGLALERLEKRKALALIKLCEGDAKPRVQLTLGTEDEESEAA